ncbi:hypothetical protein [Dyadobacter sp. CY347]|uniref:hypothetical protein n=1 Tax=Dyadobacter sp. CY347 TaxID=2909336 RepID=UPI001F443442|nr:hypothetical protein [Dyadobacter sp. CY347]MCF2487454.1 hypothetical protein [Dyadobacter sp. CY347]
MNRKKWWLLSLGLFISFLVYFHTIHPTAADPELDPLLSSAIDFLANVLTIIIMAAGATLVFSIVPKRGHSFKQKFLKAFPVALSVILILVFLSYIYEDLVAGKIG